jgi:UDPglucose--hexose-1-phosphate uridylyltransferase
MNPEHQSLKRWNPLLGEWTLFAPRTDIRPWSGATASPTGTNRPDFDPKCYLCPGVTRASGEVNPNYHDVYTFDNDFASLSMQSAAATEIDKSAQGICRVVCFSPAHNITLAEMETQDIQKVLLILCDQFKELSAIPEIEYVMMFENKGKAIGVSNPHPHGQIYATDFIPRIPDTMYASASKFLNEKGTCLCCDILEREKKRNSGIVCQNQLFSAYVPYFARFKYEVHIMPHRHVSVITDLNREEMDALTDIYHEMLIRYDNLFQQSSPNITIFYNAPCREGFDRKPWHFHIAFYPPLRNPDKLKYLAGFETGGGNIINPSFPENSARELREVSHVHYSQSKEGNI